MGSIDERKCYQCPCCRERKDCTDFQKVVDLKEAGLVIFRHSSNLDYVIHRNDDVDSSTKNTNDVFILHNTKDVEITSVDIIPALVQHKVDCPRCQYIIDHAQKLLEDISIVDKNDVIGICDHCKMKEKCVDCEKIVKKFLTSVHIRGDYEETKERLKTWLNKIQTMLKSDEKERKTVIRSQSDLSIDKLREYSRRAVHVPDVEQMFRPEKYRPSSTKPKSVFKSVYLIDQTDNTSMIDTEVEKASEHDIGPTREVRIQETEYKAEKELIKKNSVPKVDSTPDFGLSVDQLKTFFGGTIEKSRLPKIRSPTNDLSFEDIQTRTEEKIKPEKARQQMKSSLKIKTDPRLQTRKYHSEESLILPFADVPKEEPSKKGFKYYFPKEIEERKRLDSYLTSSVLIKDIQDKLEMAEKKKLETRKRKAQEVARIKEEKEKAKKLKEEGKKMDEKLKPGVTEDGTKIKKVISKVSRTALEKEEKGKPKKEKIKIDTEDGTKIKKVKSEPIRPAVEKEEKEKIKKDTAKKETIKIDEKLKPVDTEAGKKLIKEKSEVRRPTLEEKSKVFKSKIQMKESSGRMRVPIEKDVKKKDLEPKSRLMETEKENEKPIKDKGDEQTKMDMSKKTLESQKDKTTIPQTDKDKGDKQKTEMDMLKKALESQTKDKPKQDKEVKDKVEMDMLKNALEKDKTKETKEPKQDKEKVPVKEKQEKDAKDKKTDKESQLGKDKDAARKTDMLKKALESQKVKEPKEKALEKTKEIKESKQEKEVVPKEKPEQEEKKEVKEKEEKESQEKKEKGKIEGKETDVLVDKKRKEKEEFLLRAALAKQEVEEKRKKAQEEADRKAKEAASKKEYVLVPMTDIPDTSPPRTESEQSALERMLGPKPQILELTMKDIKVRKPSNDDLILRLVRMKQAAALRRKKRKSEINLSDYIFSPVQTEKHLKDHKHQNNGHCEFCLDSDLELDLESYMRMKELTKEEEKREIILGTRIIKKSHVPPIKKEEKKEPILFMSAFESRDEELQIGHAKVILDEEKPRSTIHSKLERNIRGDQDDAKGVVRYALSDRTFIDKGWTLLPTEKVVRKMNVYRMRPAHPEFDWFERNKNKRLIPYDTGEKFAEFDDNGRGRCYYRNGRLALNYYDAEEINAQQRFVIYSSGEPDERGRSRPITVLATFDYLGNGVVFDHGGKIRLKYNQTEGVVLDRGIGPVSHWKWHTLNDPPVLQQVMIDTHMTQKDPEIIKLGKTADDKTRPDNEEMLAIEFDNFIKEKSKKSSQKFKPFQIKMKALKINEYFSLRVLDQATVYLIYRDGSTNLKLNIGMLLDHKEIVDTDTAEVGEVSNNVERFPAKTDSLAGLQHDVAFAQRYERLRTERDHRLQPPQPSASVDQLTAATSRPLRPPLLTARSGSTLTGDCHCKQRKPSANNLYYDTRLI